jgi:hypothetical protein
LGIIVDDVTEISSLQLIVSPFALHCAQLISLYLVLKGSSLTDVKSLIAATVSPSDFCWV